MPSAQPSEVRLAELVATLSLGTDLELGQPMEHVIRQTLIARRMSELVGFDESERAAVYYSGLLACRPVSKYHLLIDATGIPLAFSITGGNPNDVTQLIPLLDGVPAVRDDVGRPRRRPDMLIADRG